MNKEAYWTKPENSSSSVTIDEIMTFRKVFLGSEDGKQVLKWLLLNLGLYKPVTNRDSAVLQNFAIKLLVTLDLAKQEQLESMIEHYVEIANEDALHPAKVNMLRSKLNVGRTES